MTRKRTHAREIAIQALYQFDAAQRSSSPSVDLEGLRAFIDEASDNTAVREHAWSLTSGTIGRLEELDARIIPVTRKWELSRIACVDRCILRLALYEFLEENDVPPKVVINEAIELAKKFSTEQSGSFVNGILDQAYKNLVVEFGNGDAEPVGAAE